MKHPRDARKSQWNRHARSRNSDAYVSMRTSTWAASTIVASFGNGRKLTNSHHGAMARSPSVRNDRDIRSRDPDILHPREIRNTLTNVGYGRLDTSSCSLIARVWVLSRNTGIESRCPNSLRIVSETLLQTKKKATVALWTTIQNEFAKVFTKGAVMLVRVLMRDMCKVLADSGSRYLHLEILRKENDVSTFRKRSKCGRRWLHVK